MKSPVLVFGLIAGAMLSIFLFIAMAFEEQIGFDYGAYVGYTSMVLAFLMIYFGVRSYREKNGGAVSFWRAFGIGLAITAIGSVCYVATWELYYFKLSPGFSDKYAAYAVGKAKAAGKSQAEIDRISAQMEQFKVMYQNPLINSAMTFLEPLPVGLVMTLVSAAMLRRREGAKA